MVNKSRNNSARSIVSRDGNKVGLINNSMNTPSQINNSMNKVRLVNNSTGINDSTTVSEINDSNNPRRSTFELNDFTRKDKSIVLSIIRHNGDCSGIHCVDCPITSMVDVNKLSMGRTCKSVSKDMAIQWLINTYGEREAKELIMEVLI